MIFFFFNRPCHLKFFWFMLWPPYVQIPIPSLSPLGIFYPVKCHYCCWCCSSSLWLCISKITNQIIFGVLIYPNNKHGHNAYLHNTLNNQKDPRTVLKTGPDRPVRPVQPGTGSQSSPVNTPKTGQQPVKNRKTGQKPGKNRGWTGN